MLGDITPVHIRSQAFSLYMVVSYICNILIAVYTLSAINFLGRGSDPEKNGIAKLYMIFRYASRPFDRLLSLTVALSSSCFSGIVAICLVYIYYFVEETSYAKTVSAKATEDQQALLAEEGQETVEEEFRQMTDL